MRVIVNGKTFRSFHRCGIQNSIIVQAEEFAGSSNKQSCICLVDLVVAESAFLSGICAMEFGNIFAKSTSQ